MKYWSIGLYAGAFCWCGYGLYLTLIGPPGNPIWVVYWICGALCLKRIGEYAA